MSRPHPPDEITRLYYQATRATIQRDLARAVELLKSLDSEQARERVAVYLDGLSQMRSEWAASTRPHGRQATKKRSRQA